MNRVRVFAIGSVLMFALALLAHQTGAVQSAHHHGMPSAEDHLKVLSEKLNLTSDQQTKIRPVLQELHDSAQKLMQDQSLSQEERRARHKAHMEIADKKVRDVLNEDQTKKLDELEQESHVDSHSNAK
jgi:Spy/CpxP family protein refolding chaperone